MQSMNMQKIQRKILSEDAFRSSFLFVYKVLLKKTVCIQSVMLQHLYVSSRGYYSVCHFVFVICCVILYDMS